MSGFSEAGTSAFQGLTLGSALGLLEALENSNLRTANQIRRMFSKNLAGFDEALTFLLGLGVVMRRERKLTFRRKPPTGSRGERQAWLLLMLLGVRTNYRSEVIEYLGRYQVVGGEVVYRSPVEHRSRESAVRNFLMELGVVRHDSAEGRHYLSSEYLSLYARAMEGERSVSPESLIRSRAARDEIGLAAEEAIVIFERERLGPAAAAEVDHVSLRNVAAGYDIRSVTVSSEGRRTLRCIEVKAVSSGSLRFFWTSGEIAVAKALEEAYYLYLLPVKKEGGFDFTGLRIIADPQRAVIGSQEEWTIEGDVFCCALRREEGAPSLPGGGA